MAKVTLDDLSLRDYKLTDRVRNLKDIYFRAMPEICIERPRLVTKFHLEKDLLNKERISILDKAKTYRYVLENRMPIIRHTRGYEKGMKAFKFKDDSFFAGSTTSKFKGVPLYPAFLALALWPELWTISKRTSNPYNITKSEVKKLNYEVFPHWMENNITELTRKRCYEKNLKKSGHKNHDPEMKLLERLVFFIASKPNCISHTIPDFSRAITLGLRGIIDEAKEKRAGTSDPSRKEFYEAISEVLEGIITYSQNLADEAGVQDN